MPQTTFNELDNVTSVGDLGEWDFGFGATSMTLMEMVGAILKGVGVLQDSIDSITDTPMPISLSDDNLTSIAGSVLAYDIAELDDDTTKYNLDNLIRSRLLCSVTNNHNSNGDTLTTLTTEGETKTVFNKTTNKRGEMEGIE